MKKRETIRVFLGTSQMEMAILLNVSMGQWSMYESGKRKLPLQATLLLAEMLEYMQAAEIIPKEALPVKEDAKIKQDLEHLLAKNQFELLIASRKAAEMEKKQLGYLKAVRLAEFLHSRSEKQNTEPPKILKIIESRAATGLKKNGASQLRALKTKEALLRLQQQWLTKELENFKKI